MLRGTPSCEDMIQRGSGWCWNAMVQLWWEGHGESITFLLSPLPDVSFNPCVPIQAPYSFNHLQVTFLAHHHSRHLHPSPQRIPLFFSKEFWSKSSLYPGSCQGLIRSCLKMQCSARGPSKLSPALGNPRTPTGHFLCSWLSGSREIPPGIAGVCIRQVNNVALFSFFF